MRVMFLEALQDAEQGAGSSGVPGDNAVREALFLERERGLAGHSSHVASKRQEVR